MKDNKQLIERKANFYKTNNKQVHILLDNGKFRNGSIKYIGADFLLMNDVEHNEYAIFFLEIVDIVDYVSRDKE